MYGRKRAVGAKPAVSIKSNVTVVEPHVKVKTIKRELLSAHQEKQAKEKQVKEKQAKEKQEQDKTDAVH